MDILHRHKKRMKTLKKYKETSHVKDTETNKDNFMFLNQEVDEALLKRADASEVYSLDKINYKVSEREVQELLASLEKDVSTDNILEPVFLSLFDGIMRAFKIGTKQGLTASRLYKECQSFDYNNARVTTDLDSYTQYQIEQDNISKFKEQSKHSNGTLSRPNEEVLNIRDGAKMNKTKSDHFNGSMTATDGYNPDEKIFANKRHANSVGKSGQSAETDHVVSCAEICENLKANKALNPSDIKEIVNSEDNLVVTSKHNNRGTTVGKFDKKQEKLQEEVEQGFVETKGGKEIPLSEKDRKSRQTMINKMEEAQKSIDRQVNDKVLDNIVSDSKTQQRLNNDASSAAGNQAIGELIIALVKPLYFELKDCFQNGIENGVGVSTFKAALKVRLDRMKKYVTENAKNVLEGGLLNFFKNFLTMLLEGIVNCFVGMFKQVVRMVKEGIKILFQIVPVLKDPNKTMAEKGDAIVKLIAGSAVIFASIGIETWLNSIGMGEPWSIILSSVLTAVITSLVMYFLDKIDLFGVNKDLKLRRVGEALALKNEEVTSNLNNLILQHS